MNANRRKIELDDVLDAIVAKDDQSPAALEYWIREHPEFEHELTEFMGNWALLTSATTPDEKLVQNASVDERLVLHGISIVQNLLHETSPRTERVPRVESLLGAAKAAGMTLRDFARNTQLGEAVVRKLDRRLIRFDSIPVQAVDTLAATLRCEVEAVSMYLQQPPAFVSSANYRADRAPQLAQPEHFLDAIETDPTMTDDDRSRWRAKVKGQPG
jgi:hypothetical protein